MLLNCGVGENWCLWTVLLEKTLESPLDFKEIKPVNPKGNQSWIFTGIVFGRTDAEAETPNTLVTWCEELTHWKRPWCWERLKVGGERDDRGWDGWMASPTRGAWVWASSGSWWWTGRPGVLQSMGWQKDTTEQLSWTDWRRQKTKSENYLERNQRYTISLDCKNQYCENNYKIQSNLQIQCNPYQIAYGIFHRTKTKKSTICIKI